jgi:hypothetical protein
MDDAMAIVAAQRRSGSVNGGWNVGGRSSVREQDGRKYAVRQQMEHDDMTSDQSQDKSATTQRKPSRDRQPSAAEQPQVPSPLSNDGPELVRDSHC